MSTGIVLDIIELKLLLIHGHDADVDGDEPHAAQLLSLYTFIEW